MRDESLPSAFYQGRRSNEARKLSGYMVADLVDTDQRSQDNKFSAQCAVAFRLCKEVDVVRLNRCVVTARS